MVTTRASLLLCSAVAVACTFVACNGSNSGTDPAEVCPTICQKEADCELLGSDTYTDCLAECLGYAENMLDGYLAAYTDCTESKTCAELEAGVTSQGLCYEENVSLCTTNTEAWVEQACRTTLSCDGIDEPTEAQLATCADRMHGDGNILICFEPAVVAALVDCVASATDCNPSPVSRCAMEVVGLELGRSGQNQ